jgi:hypothetical protein
MTYRARTGDHGQKFCGHGCVLKGPQSKSLGSRWVELRMFRLSRVVYPTIAIFSSAVRSHVGASWTLLDKTCRSRRMRHVTSACHPSLTERCLSSLVLGDDPSHIFTIEIADSKDVSALKELIKDKKKPAFDHVPADTLNIFRVSFPVDDDLEATLNRFRRRPEHDRDNGFHHLSRSVK